ncbi:MAG TPA: hypothetical protein VF821_32285, partial [Lentzea sp.]
MSRTRAVGFLMFVIGMASIGWYSLVAGVVNAQPPTTPFDGWVSVLRSTGGSGPEQLVLRAVAVEPGVRGDRPRVSFSVLACGERPFRGVLVLAGQARLDDA